MPHIVRTVQNAEEIWWKNSVITTGPMCIPPCRTLRAISANPGRYFLFNRYTIMTLPKGNA